VSRRAALYQKLGTSCPELLLALQPGAGAAVGRAVGWEPSTGTWLCFAFSLGFFVRVETQIMWGGSTQKRSGVGISSPPARGAHPGVCWQRPLAPQPEASKYL